MVFEKHGLQIFMSNRRQIKNLMGHSVDFKKLYSWKESNVVACQGTVWNFDHELNRNTNSY